jgi:hypothetical protein
MLLDRELLIQEEIQVPVLLERLFQIQELIIREEIQILELREVKLQNQEHIRLVMIPLEPYLHQEVPTLVAEEVREDLAEVALLEVEDLAVAVVEEDKKLIKPVKKHKQVS